MELIIKARHMHNMRLFGRYWIVGKFIDKVVWIIPSKNDTNIEILTATNEHMYAQCFRIWALATYSVLSSSVVVNASPLPWKKSPAIHNCRSVFLGWSSTSSTAAHSSVLDPTMAIFTHGRKSHEWPWGWLMMTYNICHLLVSLLALWAGSPQIDTQSGTFNGHELEWTETYK